jgi:large subunit ribosomal protein L4
VQLDVFNSKGETTGKITVSDDIFAIPVNEAVVHQALVQQLANKRLGTASTKTRSDVKVSSRKLYAQKHTGRARKGSADSPVLVGGAVTFGPQPRSYRQDMPKKMRRLAIKSCLSDKASSGLLKVVDKFDLDKPNTKYVENMLISLGIATTVLIATTDDDVKLIVSARNLPGVRTVPARLINTADLLSYKTVIMSKDAIKTIEELWGSKAKSAKTSTGE